MRHVFLTAALGALLLTACENKDKEAASRVEEPYVPLERVDAPSQQRWIWNGIACGEI